MPTLHAFAKSTQQKCKDQSELWEEEFKAFCLFFFWLYEYLLLQFRSTLLENSFGATNLNSALHYIHRVQNFKKKSFKTRAREMRENSNVKVMDDTESRENCL